MLDIMSKDENNHNIRQILILAHDHRSIFVSKDEMLRHMETVFPLVIKITLLLLLLHFMVLGGQTGHDTTQFMFCL